jgi:hypothetical protein
VPSAGERGTRVVDLGAPEGEQYTLGGWTTGCARPRLGDGSPSVALAAGTAPPSVSRGQQRGPARDAPRAGLSRRRGAGGLGRRERAGAHRWATRAPRRSPACPPTGLRAPGHRPSAGRRPASTASRCACAAGAGRSRGRGDAGARLDAHRRPRGPLRGRAQRARGADRALGDQPLIAPARDERVGYTLRVPAGARLRGVLRPGPAVALSVARDGHATWRSPSLAPGPSTWTSGRSRESWCVSS